MAISFTEDRLEVPSYVVTRAIEGATILFNTETARYFTLDEIGSRTWTLLTSSPTVQSAYDALLAEFAVEPDQLRHDLEALVESLRTQGLLEIRRA